GAAPIPLVARRAAACSGLDALVSRRGRVELDIVGQPGDELLEIRLHERRQHEIAAPQPEIQERPVGMRGRLAHGDLPSRYGRMLWFVRKALSGSQARLMATSRSIFSDP